MLTSISTAQAEILLQTVVYGQRSDLHLRDTQFVSRPDVRPSRPKFLYTHFPEDTQILPSITRQSPAKSLPVSCLWSSGYLFSAV